MKAIIIGAGIAGLATGVRLRRAGWETVVVERAPALRDGGWAVNFAGLGYDAAERLGLVSRLRDRHLVYDEIAYLDDRGHDTRLSRRSQEAMLGPRSLNLMRRDIEHVLADAYDGELRFDAALTAVDQDDDTVRVAFADGTTETADLLVGADGLHSTVRSLAFGPERDVRLDLDHMIGIYDLTDIPADIAPRTSVSYNAPGRQVGVAHLDGDRAIAFLAWHTTDVDGALADDPRATVRRVFDGAGWHTPALLDQVPESFYLDTVSQIRMPGRHRGRVVLVGDAAWCVTLFAGYGSSLAVGGADALGTALERDDDVGRALAAWERDLRPTVEKKQAAGRRAKDLFVPADPFRLGLRRLSLQVAASPLVSHLLERRHRASTARSAG